MSNVVMLDRSAAARGQSERVKRSYVQARIAPELRAIRRNRIARLASTRRFVAAMCIASGCLGVVGGAWLSTALSSTMPIQVMQLPEQSPAIALPVTLPDKVTMSTAVSGVEHTQTFSRANLADRGLPTTALTEVTQQVAAVAVPKNSPLSMPPSRVANTNPPAGAAKDLMSSDRQAASKPKADGGVYEVTERFKPPAPARGEPSASSMPAGWKVVGVPVDGILNLEVGGAVRSYRVGDRLPNGAVLAEASAERNSFKTNER